jgi:hypothetical protein
LGVEASHERHVCKWVGQRAALVRFVVVVSVVLGIWSPLLRSGRVNNSALDWTFRTDYAGYTLHALAVDGELPFGVTSPERRVERRTRK